MSRRWRQPQKFQLKEMKARRVPRGRVVLGVQLLGLPKW